MPLVRVKPKFQVTLPESMRRKAGIAVGDLFDVDMEDGKITMTAKRLVDRQLAEALEDIEKGRVSGPFDSAREMMESFEEEHGITRTRLRR